MFVSGRSPAEITSACKCLRVITRAAVRLALACVMVAQLLGICVPARAQAGEWAWIGGSQGGSNTTSGPSGVYGVLGTPDLSNMPGGREDAQVWIDHSGTVWLFGGVGIDSKGKNGVLSDFWKYDPSTNEWTWMAGESKLSTASISGGCYAGVYGTIGKPSKSNLPGGPEYAARWTDRDGNLWMFGGSGCDSTGTSGALSDLWMFNPSIKEWTWVNGGKIADGAPAYGTEGTPSTSKNPGDRYSAVVWTDLDGSLWLFGGFVGENGIGAYTDDLWKYDPATNEWTWVNGDDSVVVTSWTAGNEAVYGTKSVASPKNIPGGRESGTAWTDADGNFWLFGGFGLGANSFANFAPGQGSQDDLWMYNPKTNEWTWEGGGNNLGSAQGLDGVYGTKGVAAASNLPGSRINTSEWTDADGHVWIFGGSGFDGDGHDGDLNDLWMYNPSRNEWSWEGGSLYEGFFEPNGYGTRGVAGPASLPPPRSDAAYWTDSAGNFWMFGGDGLNGGGTTEYYNDLWRLNAPVALVRAPQVSLSAAAVAFSSTAIGDSSAAQLIKLTNTGNAALEITKIAIGGVDPTSFDIGTSSCGTKLAAADACTVSVKFAPRTKGTLKALLEFADNAGKSPQKVSLAGVGFDGPAITLSVASLSFPKTTVDSKSTSKTVKLTNSGNATLKITGIAVKGPDASSFITTNNCGTEVAKGRSCTISVAFSPKTKGALNASVALNDNTASSPKIALRGTGY